VLGEILDGARTAVTVFESAPGAWTVEIYSDGAIESAVLRAAVRAAGNAQAAERLAFTRVPENDWVSLSLAGLAPVRAGRFVVHGAHDRARIPANAIGIEIEAALAFGTGHHGTTRGCLLAFESLLKKHGSAPLRVLDIGTGTGVLAIAAARALHGVIVASDIDPVSVCAARLNARANRVGGYVLVLQAAGLNAPGIRAGGPYNLVFANILLTPLKRLAQSIARLTAHGGRVVLSGLLPHQADAARFAYTAQGMRLERRMEVAGWCTLILRRPRCGRVSVRTANRGRS
jgi:ribosomal protein L11 methyltransferase